MLMVLYSALLSAGLLLSAPWWLTRMLLTDRYREGLGERLGRVPERLRTAVQGKRVVWVHAVSVGEVLAASRLIHELETALNSQLPLEHRSLWTVVVSTTTRTGQTLARERFGPERVFYFPFDFASAVRAYRRALNPALLILLESELWPRVLHEFSRTGVPVAVANARVSDRSFRRAQQVRPLWKRLLGKATLWLVQSEADAARLLALGASANAVQVTGNLKYDIRAPQTSRIPEWIREAAADRPVIVAGSTTDDAKGLRGGWEESIIIQAWQGEPRHQHAALLVLAPRHPERFGLVESLIMEFAYAKASDWADAAAGTQPFAQELAEEPTRNEVGLTPWQGPSNFFPRHKGRLDIVLLDTIGDLAAVYAVADIAFVGGSLVHRGGHNPLEPAQFGVPVVMGPSFENFRDIVTKLQTANAICVIEESDTLDIPDALETAMLKLLHDREAARAMGERARRVFSQEGGATARTVAALLTLIGHNTGPSNVLSHRPVPEEAA